MKILLEVLTNPLELINRTDSTAFVIAVFRSLVFNRSMQNSIQFQALSLNQINVTGFGIFFGLFDVAIQLSRDKPTTVFLGTGGDLYPGTGDNNS